MTRQLQGKRWCFTLNNPTEDDIKILEGDDGDHFQRIIFQEEIGKEGTPHLQGAFVFAKRARATGVLNAMLGHKRTHVEMMKGTLAQAGAYAHKDDTRLPGGKRVKRNWPRPLEKMTRAELRDEQKTIADKYTGEEDAKYGRTIDWYWEDEGGWGKSILTKYMVDRMGALLIQGANKDCLYTVAKYVEANEEGPKIIIFDIPRCNRGAVSYNAIESIKNGRFNSPKYESCMVAMNSPWILVFANQEPDRSQLSADRWNVMNLRVDEAPEEELEEKSWIGMNPLLYQ